MVQWNASPIEALKPRQQKSDAIASAKKLLVSGGVCMALSRYLDTPLALLGIIPVTSIFNGIGYLLLALAGFIAVHAFTMSFEKPPVWESTLDDKQRHLLGLERSPAPLAATKTPTSATKAATPSPLLRPPERTAALPTLVSTATGRTPSPLPSHRSLSSPFDAGLPRSASRDISTPEQLKRVLDEFDMQTDSGLQGASLGADQHHHNGGGVSFNNAALTVPSPTPYRPSLRDKETEVLPLRVDGRLAASTPDQKAAVMKRLGVTQAMLESGVEKLREWLSEHVLQPLDQAISTAHIDVIKTSERLGMAQGLQLSPLSDIGSTSASVADDSLRVATLCAELMHKLSPWGSNPNNYPPEALACLEAINKYRKLISLLRGEFPPGILPPTPEGYVAARIQDLAQGTCMMAFAWNNGGRWNGKSWSADLPTDSVLVLYLFAAFLAAPRWMFPKEPEYTGSVVEGPAAGILYLGKLPPKMVKEFFAVLSSRPPVESQMTGVLGLQLGSLQPHYGLTIDGKTILTSSDQLALFEVLLLFLVHCRSNGGVIGSRSMEYMGLDDVAKKESVSWSDYGWGALKATRNFVFK